MVYDYSNKINIQYHKTDVGEFILGSFEQKLCLMDYRYRKMRISVDKRIQKGAQASTLKGMMMS